MVSAVMTGTDPFIQAVEDARRELSHQRGREITTSELIRLAGLEGQRSKVFYHLNANTSRPNGHRVPREIVRALAAVLPITEDDLMKAAQVAAGYQVRGEAAGDQPDYGFEVARFLDSDDVTEDEKAALALRLTEILADHLRRGVVGRRPTRNGQ